MKCANCGEEIEEGMRFCGTCGAPVPQEKACVSCGAKIPLKMKFCPECGAPQDGSRPKAAAAIAMGDKNVIAGDVTGKKEETHISGNATIIKNEDQTKQVKRCHVCGRMVLVTQGFECPSCGEFTCENCYDSASGLCKTCAGKKTSGKADKYRAAVKDALADGRIDFADRRKLDTLQRELGLAREEALAIEAEEKNGGGAKAASGGELSTVERLEFESVTEQFYSCTGKEGELLAKARKLYEAHPASEQVLGLYLPLLAATEGGAEKAMGIIKSLPVDVLAAYMTAADICLAQGDLAQTENYVNRAKAIWQDDPLVLCREAYLSLALHKQYGRQEFLDKADAIAQNVGALQLQDKLAKSHRARLSALVAQAKGGDVPAMDADYCKQNGLYFRIAGNGKAKRSVEIKDNDALKLAVQNAKDGDRLPVLPGIYCINFAIDKGVVIEGKEGEKYTNFEFDESIPITASAVFRGVKFICRAATASEKNMLDVSGTAKPQFAGCAFEKCGISARDSARPSIEGCDIAGAYDGIAVTDHASVDCSGTTVHDAANWGINIDHSSQSPDVQSVFKDVKVETCEKWAGGVEVKGTNANPEFSNVTVHTNKGPSFRVSDNADPVMEQCKAYDGESSGFFICDGGKGTYRGCEAYRKNICFSIANATPVMEQCKAYDSNSGFSFFGGGGGTFRGCEAYGIGLPGFDVEKADPVLEQCKSHDGESSGFFIRGGKGTYRGCEAYGNKLSGFEIRENADPVIEQCKAYNSIDGGGFFIHKGGKGTYRACEAYGNKCVGFEVKDGCACTFTDCKSGTNSFSKTTGGTGFSL